MITNNDDIIDSREVIARIEELKAEWAENTNDDPDDYALSEDDWSVGLGTVGARELVSLLELAKDGETNLADWMHGETLIRDSYFEEYARQLADDIGAIDADASWPLTFIDWERAADALKMDYHELDFDGVTYWGRS